MGGSGVKLLLPIKYPRGRGLQQPLTTKSSSWPSQEAQSLSPAELLFLQTGEGAKGGTLAPENQMLRVDEACHP